MQSRLWSSKLILSDRVFLAVVPHLCAPFIHTRIVGFLGEVIHSFQQVSAVHFGWILHHTCIFFCNFYPQNVAAWLLKCRFFDTLTLKDRKNSKNLSKGGDNKRQSCFRPGRFDFTRQRRTGGIFSHSLLTRHMCADHLAFAKLVAIIFLTVNLCAQT